MRLDLPDQPVRLVLRVLLVRLGQSVLTALLVLPDRLVLPVHKVIRVISVLLGRRVRLVLLVRLVRLRRLRVRLDRLDPPDLPELLHRHRRQVI